MKKFTEMNFGSRVGAYPIYTCEKCGQLCHNEGSCFQHQNETLHDVFAARFRVNPNKSSEMIPMVSGEK